MFSRRHVIVHYHIFKNAGTSVDVALQACFGERWAAFDGVGPHDIITSQRLGAFLQKSPRLQAVSSHLARPPLPSRGCHPIVFLRHPLLRARSVYAFVRNDPIQPQHKAAARGSFGDFLQHHLDDYAGLGRVICDYQVFHLSAGSFRASANGGHDVIDADLLEAKRGLKSWGYVGLVENFGQSLQRYANTYSRFFTKLTLEPSHQNWSETSNLAVNEALAVLEESLDPHIIQRFVQHNQRDYELYRWASNTFHA